MAPFLQWKPQAPFHYYLISNLRATDGCHYGKTSDYYGDQQNENGNLHEASAFFSFSLFPKTAFNNNSSKTPLLAVENPGVCKCFSALFCFPIDHTGKAVENLCQLCDPAGLKGNALSQEYQGTLWSLKREQGNFSVSPKTYCLLGVTTNNDEPWTIAPRHGDSSDHSLQGLCASRGQVKRMMEDYFPASGYYLHRDVSTQPLTKAGSVSR